MNNPRPKLLSAGMVQQALSDPKFFQLLPKFAQLKPKMITAAAANKPAQTKRRGCGGCQQRRAAHNLFNEFVQMANTLDEQDRKLLRQYFGGQQLLSAAINPRNNRVEQRRI